MLSKILTSKNLLLASTLYLLFFVAYGFLVFFAFRDQKLELTQAGLFGEMFGAINAFFTGLAFLAVAVSIGFQLKESGESKRIQRNYQFENTFFSLLSILHEVIQSSKQLVRTEGETITIQGAHYFHRVFASFKEQHTQKVSPRANQLFQDYKTAQISKGIRPEEILQNYSADLDELLPILTKAYEEFYQEHDAYLGHYFRFLYNIIKFVIESFPVEPEMQTRYIGLIQAQMSNDELGLLFYNCLSIHGMNTSGIPQFKEWLDGFNFFENIDGRLVFDIAYTRFYPKTKFKFMLQRNRN